MCRVANIVFKKGLETLRSAEGEVYIFRGRGVFIDVYKVDDKIATSGATSLADIDLRRTYRAIRQCRYW